MQEETVGEYQHEVIATCQMKCILSKARMGVRGIHSHYIVVHPQSVTT